MYVEKINFCFPDPQQTKSPHIYLKKNIDVIQVVKEIFKISIFKFMKLLLQKQRKISERRISVKSTETQIKGNFSLDISYQNPTLALSS